MPALKLLLNLALYYAVMAAALLVVLWIYPPLQDHLPIGRVQALLAQSITTSAPVDGIAKLAHDTTVFAGVPSFVGSLIWLAAAMLGALLAAFPVSWVYMHVRDPGDYDQSLVDTIVMLPLVVTSIVVIVQHSLALAFSLAGIAGAARFRNTLKSSGDLLFVLLAIAIGLSAGIGAVELAIMSSAAFNLCFVVLWFTSYGERRHMKRFLGEIEHPHGRATSNRSTPRSDENGTGAESDAEPAADRKMKQADWKGL